MWVNGTESNVGCLGGFCLVQAELAASLLAMGQCSKEVIMIFTPQDGSCVAEERQRSVLAQRLSHTFK